MSSRILVAAASAATLVCSAVLIAEPAVAADGPVLRAVADGYAYDALTGTSDDEALVSGGRLVIIRHAAPGFQQVPRGCTLSSSADGSTATCPIGSRAALHIRYGAGDDFLRG